MRSPDRVSASVRVGTATSSGRRPDAALSPATVMARAAVGTASVAVRRPSSDRSAGCSANRGSSRRRPAWLAEVPAATPIRAR